MKQNSFGEGLEQLLNGNGRGDGVRLGNGGGSPWSEGHGYGRNYPTKGVVLSDGKGDEWGNGFGEGDGAGDMFGSGEHFS